MDLNNSVCQSDTYLVIDLSGGAHAKKYPVRYTEIVPDLSSDTCRTTELWLKHIVKGKFTMGECDERHEVTLTQDFYIGVFPVTQRQWELVMGNNPSNFKDSGPGAPVEMVSYDDICGKNRPWPADDSVRPRSFLGKLRAKTGMSFDLPTEAQWEYACRAGTTTAFSVGNACDGTQCTCKVGSYPPNPWGLYDLYGNFWESCADWNGNHSDATDPKGASTGSCRVYRSGGWYNLSVRNCHPTYRYGYKPFSRLRGLGFRIVALPVF